MDAPKFVPQLFYDLIGRVIPGGLAIIGISLAFQVQLSEILSDLFSSTPALKESALFLAAFLFAVSYLVGHLMAPLSDSLMSGLKYVLPIYFHILRKVVSGKYKRYTSVLVDFFRTETGYREGEAKDTEVRYLSLIYIWADWLQIEQPEAGARLAKIRAECRLHAETTVAACLTLLCHAGAVQKGIAVLSRPLVLTAAVVAVLGAWSYGRQFRIFEWGVLNNYYAARNATPVTPQPTEEPKQEKPILVPAPNSAAPADQKAPLSGR